MLKLVTFILKKDWNFMKFLKTLIVSVFLLSCLMSIQISAGDLSSKLSEKGSQFVSNLIGGNGLTEVSVDVREGNEPDYSILLTREIIKTEEGNFFTQFSLFNTEHNDDERIIANLGIGSRKLFDDNTMMAGYNAFIDLDTEAGHQRGSVGGELRNAVLDLRANYYKGLHNGFSTEKVLDGWEYYLASQVPYLHWADIFMSSYKWDGIDRDDIEGTKLGTELLISPSINFELAFDDKDKEGLEDEWYAKLMFVHPPQEGPTALDGISQVAWKENKDMSGELLSKVKRQNKIMIEFKGLSTISRTD